jgi:glycosyltransferase involved in cell wall biosynthesis
MPLNRKKILFVEQFNPYKTLGGIERFVVTLSDKASAKYECEIAFSQSTPKLKLPKTPLSIFLAAKVLSSGCDIIHANGWTGSACFLAKRLRSIPLITTNHASSYGILNSPMGKQMSLLSRVGLQEVRLHEHIVFRESDVIVAVSELVRNEMKVGYGVKDEKILTIHNGIDVSHFCPREKKKDTSKLIVGAVGRMDNVQKGFPDLISAYSRLSDNIKLRMFGRIPLNYGRYSMGNPSYSELPAAYNSFDIFVQTSLYESFGLALIEAMACGLPVVTTSVGIAQEIIEDGKNGFIVPVGDVKAISDRIRILASDYQLRIEMGRKARETAENFSLEAMVTRYLNLYVDLLERKS